MEHPPPDGRNRAGLGRAGDIRVTKSVDDQMTVKATRREGTTGARIIVAETAKGAAVCADWKTAAPTPRPCASTTRVLSSGPPASLAAVDLEIAVPDGTSIEARSEAGGITVGPLSGSVAAQTYDGNIRVASTGARIDAENQRGEIRIDLVPEEIKQKISASTIHGSLTVAIPPTRLVHYELYTHGAFVRSGYPLSGGPTVKGLPYDYARGRTANLSGNLGPDKSRIWSRLELYTTNGDAAKIEIVQP